MAQTPAQTPLPPAPVAPAASVAQTVWGILGYSRWPGQLAVVQLCVVGESPYVSALLAGSSLPDGRRVEVQRIGSHLPDLLKDCHAVYAGRLVSGQWQRLMATWPQGQPLLTLSEDAADCRQGGMFCLDASRPQVSFELNLDSLARSGVRVNPRVLGLARHKEGR